MREGEEQLRALTILTLASNVFSPVDRMNALLTMGRVLRYLITEGGNMTSQIKKDTQKKGKYKVNGENTGQCTWTDIEFPKSLRVSSSECMGGSSM